MEVNEQMKEAAYEAGFQARKNREPAQNGLAQEGVLRIEWSRGWKAASLLLGTSPELLRALNESYMTADIASLDSLTEEQRPDMVAWLESAPPKDADDAAWQTFGDQRPPFVVITDRVDGHSRRVVEFTAVASAAVAPSETATEVATTESATSESAAVGSATETATPPKQDKAGPKYINRVLAANKRLHKYQYAVANAEAEVEQARGNLKKAIGDRDAAVVELQKVIEGQQPLPGMEPVDEDEASGATVPAATGHFGVSDAAVAGANDTWAISELGAKALKATVGKELFDACNERQAPIGLTAAQLDKFDAIGITTIAQLEERMRAGWVDGKQWFEFLAKKADAAVVTRVTDSLFEFRRKHPAAEPGEPTKTVVESLAEKNAPASDSQPAADAAAEVQTAPEAASESATAPVAADQAA